MFAELKDIYNLFDDEESKMIFRSRLLYGLTGNMEYIKEMLLSFKKENKGFYDILDVLENPDFFRNREIILFGTGAWGPWVEKWLKFYNLDIQYFCDNDIQKVGKDFRGKKIISAGELLNEHKDAWVFITTEFYEQEIIQQLLENDFPDEQIIRLSYSFAKDKMYRDEMLSPSENEIFIDGGSYDGKDSLDFIDWAGESNVQKIYVFEPSYDNFVKCQKNLGGKCNTGYEVLNYGLWSHKDVLSFSDNLGQGSNLNSNGTIKVPVISIDEVVGDDKVTFIKMDIEGAELEALKGAAETIKKHKPRLAICLYHKDEDIVDIPKYIKELVAEYKLYIRHYSPYTIDTVLYAVVE